MKILDGLIILICSAIINQVIDSNNVKEEYMSLAIEKKFFRLAL